MISGAQEMDYQSYLKTQHWAKRRAKALKQSRHHCQLCGANYDLHVHHNSYDRLGNERDDDLVVLCRNCHSRFHATSPPDANVLLADDRMLTIRSAEEHRALLLVAMVAVCDGRMSIPQANALVGLSAEVHKSIRQQWDMLLYASDNLKLSPGNRLCISSGDNGGEEDSDEALG